MNENIPPWLAVPALALAVVLGWALIGWALGEFRCDQ